MTFHPGADRKAPENPRLSADGIATFRLNFRACLKNIVFLPICQRRALIIIGSKTKSAHSDAAIKIRLLKIINMLQIVHSVNKNRRQLMKLRITPTQQELSLEEDEIIVSKTDLTGRITYVNRAFMKIANFSESESLGQQHNLVRHPDMPRGAFKLLWDTLNQGREFFGYVKNLTSEGHFYWVFANVTPDYDASGNIIGYFSVRTKPSREAINTMQGIYQEMLAVESRAGAAKAPAASIEFLQAKLKSLGTTYDRFILSTLEGSGS
jgi:PAS domain S-box-containing protein